MTENIKFLGMDGFKEKPQELVLPLAIINRKVMDMAIKIAYTPIKVAEKILRRK